jgi:hypothetical protein
LAAEHESSTTILKSAIGYNPEPVPSILHPHNLRSILMLSSHLHLGLQISWQDFRFSRRRRWLSSGKLRHARLTQRPDNRGSSTSETSVCLYQITRCNIPEDSHFLPSTCFPGSSLIKILHRFLACPHNFPVYMHNRGSQRLGQITAPIRRRTRNKIRLVFWHPLMASHPVASFLILSITPMEKYFLLKYE